jgi:mxaJ protein
MTLIRITHHSHPWFAAAALLVTLACAAPDAQAQETPARKALKVCQDPNNLPFSNVAGEGIENRLAELFGQALGLPVSYYSFPARLGFIRNTLRFKLPGEDYPCDIVMGVPVGFDQVSVTKPVYRSTYALVYPKGRGLDGVESVADFLALGPQRLKQLRIGLHDRSPASEWLRKHDLVDQGVPYAMMNPDPAQYPGELLEKELASGKVDVAIVWGPIAGFFAKRVSSPALKVVPMKSEPGVRFEYEMAMGVRYGEREWKQQVEALIDSQRAQIRAILAEYQVPLISDDVAAVK